MILQKITLLKGFSNGQKNGALIAHPEMSKKTVKQRDRNSALDVWTVSEHFFGSVPTPNNLKSALGLSCGLRKVIQFDNYVSIQGTVGSNYTRSKITGSIGCLMNLQTTRRINT